MSKLSINFEEIHSRAHGNLEEQNKALEPSIITINSCISTINALYNYHIYNLGLFGECDMKENVAVTGLLLFSV